MNRRSIQFLVLSCLCMMAVEAVAQRSQAPKNCLAKSQTQLELNEAAGAEDAAADHELNRVYQLILKKYADNPTFIKRLREAQIAWLKFRDAQIEMRFPTSAKGTPNAQYGSVYPMCYASYKASLTNQRSKELREWLVGIEEGDVCSGSVKRPEDLK